MITTIDIINLGWKHLSTAKDGGSKHFVRKTSQGMFLIQNHSDNFTMKNHKDFYKITIKELRDLSFITLYEGFPKDINELNHIFATLNIDIKETRKEKLNEIQKHSDTM